MAVGSLQLGVSEPKLASAGILHQMPAACDSILIIFKDSRQMECSQSARDAALATRDCPLASHNASWCLPKHLPNPVRSKVKHVFHQEKLSVLFFCKAAISLKKKAAIATATLIFLAVAIVYNGGAVLRFLA